jgi:aminomethyltransferase
LNPVWAGVLNQTKAISLVVMFWLSKKLAALERQIVCLKGTGKAAPRQGYSVFDGDKEVGKVTSGAPGVFVGYPLAFALVPLALTKIGTELSIGIRDTKVPASVVSRPWYKRKK